MTVEEPLRLTFEVGVEQQRAFEYWTERAAVWWPKGHTVSGDPQSIVFEPFVGGRIIERAADGSEHTWGEITGWDEPTRLAFRWHLFFDPQEATEVSITFEPDGPGTRILLEQTGFAALGEVGHSRREGNGRGWTATISHFADALARLAET